MLNEWIYEARTHAKRNLLRRFCLLCPLVPDRKILGIRQKLELNVPIKADTSCSAHQLHLACNVTAAADRRPSSSGANSEQPARLEPGYHQRPSYVITY